MARPLGFEPKTLCLEGRCSIQLSYGRCPDSIEFPRDISLRIQPAMSPTMAYYARERAKGKLDLEGATKKQIAGSGSVVENPA